MLDLLYFNRIELYQYFLFFVIYSFFGWIIEVIYRSVKQKEFVNAGFLYSTFVPVYGIGACLIVFLNYVLKDENLLVQIVVYGTIPTIIEFFIGILSERIFDLKLWDYSENRFNFLGKVCLSFSLAWAVLSFILITLIHPVIQNLINNMEEKTLIFTSGLMISYLTIDAIYSTLYLKEFKEKTSYLFAEYFSFNSFDIEKLFTSYERIFNAFPDLKKHFHKRLNMGLKKRVNVFLDTVNQKIIDIKAERKPVEREYDEIVKDILANDQFMRLQDYFHHDSSILDHVKKVSYFSYRISKYLKLDYRSAARGALLHDFFLYDWRNHNKPDLAKEKLHGFAHPKIALKNSEENFSLNEIEKDIITKHMWPLTPRPPKYRESFVVTFADKYVTSKELLSNVKRKTSDISNNRT